MSSDTQDELFRTAIAEFGPVLDRVAAGYEADPDKRKDLRQEIYLQVWRSLELFDGRCALKTWCLRVAHNTAVSYVSRETRWRSRFTSLEDLEAQADPAAVDTVSRTRALEQLHEMIRELKPLDRQVILLWLEDVEGAAIAEITGLSPANVGMKIHRLRRLLARRFHEEQICRKNQST